MTARLKITQTYLIRYITKIQTDKCYDSQEQSSGNIRQLLRERIERANSRRELSAEEAQRLYKLEAIAQKRVALK
jgi:hypothetical protein